MLQGMTVECETCGQTKPRAEFYDLPHTTKPRKPCKECLRAARRARYATGDSRAQLLRERHGLTPAAYEAMLAAQNGVCAVCARPETTPGRGGTPRHLGVDRGRHLLCRRCHDLVRAAEADPALLDRVRTYLARRGR